MLATSLFICVPLKMAAYMQLPKSLFVQQCSAHAV